MRQFLRILAVLALLLASGVAHGERIKDLATIAGIRNNQLIGYGLVVGLDGSGDQTTQTPFTVQAYVSMLSNLGVNLPPGTTLQLKNVAAVMVTTNLPAFARPGQQIDVTVSSLGNAKSLRGGTLVMTPLKGADGSVYAMAQGNVVVGGAGATGGGSSVTVNHLSAGLIAAGATVERAVPSTVGQGETVTLELGSTDFGTVQRVVEAINEGDPARHRLCCWMVGRSLCARRSSPTRVSPSSAASKISTCSRCRPRPRSSSIAVPDRWS